MIVRTVANSLVGQTLGHYKILDQLGAGGMGVVYRAQDTKLGRQVALKVLPMGNTSSEEAVERFRREARTASSLNHPNICTIYGFDEHEGQLYLAMELLDGEPLDRRLSGRPLDLRTDARHRGAGRRRARRGARRRHPASRRQAGQHLPHAPRPGEGARLRPREAVARIPALGPAPRCEDTRRSPPEHFTSVAGTTVGTIAYMSPEQARGDDVDPRTDLFSFGVVLYEMATGRQSFPGHTTAVVFDGILNRDPVPPSTHQRDAAARARSHRLEGAREGSRACAIRRRPTSAPISSACGATRDRARASSPRVERRHGDAPDAATVVMPSTAHTTIGGPSGIGSAPTVARRIAVAAAAARCIGGAADRREDAVDVGRRRRRRRDCGDRRRHRRVLREPR